MKISTTVLLGSLLCWVAGITAGMRLSAFVYIPLALLAGWYTGKVTAFLKTEGL